MRVGESYDLRLRTAIDGKVPPSTSRATIGPVRRDANIRSDGIKCLPGLLDLIEAKHPCRLRSVNMSRTYIVSQSQYHQSIECGEHDYTLYVHAQPRTISS